MSKAPCIVLIGVSGAGKSTVGVLVARALGIDLVEADDLVASATGMTIADHVIQGTENLAELRRGAARAAFDLVRNGGVVTLGASQIEDEETRDLVLAARRQGARVVELVADVADIARREGLNAPRSLGLGAPRTMLVQMIAALRSGYADVADSSVETGGRTPDEVAEAVVAACRLAGDSKPE